MLVEGKLFPYKKQICKLFELAEKILEENFQNVVVSVNFISEEAIKELNDKHRKVNKVTDVLSFPNLEKKPSQKLTEFKDQIVDDQLFLGDIVICKSKAKQQSKEYGHSLKREICFLALHGLLHLLGYDHIEKEDEILMQNTAETILNSFGVRR